LLLLVFLITLGISWTPLLWLTPLLIASTGVTLVQAARAANRANFNSESLSKLGCARDRFLVAWLHLVQPAGRLLGRVQHGLGPWSWKGSTSIAPLPTVVSLWSEQWKTVQSRLSKLESILKEAGVPVISGGNFDSWDLSIPGGLFGTVRVITMVEEHGDGKQLLRLRAWPKVAHPVVAMFSVFVAAAGSTVLDGAAIAGTSLALLASALGLLVYGDCAVAMGSWLEAINQYVSQDSTVQRIKKRSHWSWARRSRTASK
jgi:O-antigen biosynthesis protein